MRTSSSAVLQSPAMGSTGAVNVVRLAPDLESSAQISLGVSLCLFGCTIVCSVWGTVPERPRTGPNEFIDTLT